MTLREYRQRAGLTLQQFALLLGVHFTTVQKWEMGERIPDAVGVTAIERLTRGKVRASSFTRQGGPTAIPAAGSPVRASARRLWSRRPRKTTTGASDDEERREGRAHG